MAARVLKGEASASEQNFETITEPAAYVNAAVAGEAGIEIPEEYSGDAATTFDTIEDSTQAG
jgi:putative ABC transport system substrate-binding protein